jgi:hypothetical protein
MTLGTASRKVLLAALVALAAGSALPEVLAPTEARAQVVQVQAGRYGPFATMRRANEVATYFRNRGYSAHAYPEWGSYYVNVWEPRP